MSIICSFEALFVLFLFSGRYKSDPRFDWIPVDITALTFALSAASGVTVLAMRRGRWLDSRTKTILFTYALFVFVAALSLLWTPSENYSHTKVLYLGTLVAWCLYAGAVIIGPEPVRVQRLAYAMAIFSVWVGFESAMSFLAGPGQGFVTVLGDRYLGIGRVLGIGSVAFLSCWTYWATTIRMRFVAAAAVVALAILLLVVGGKGPFLATLASVLVLVLSGIRVHTRHGFVIGKAIAALTITLVMGALGGAMFMADTGTTTTTIQRLALMGSDDFDRSSATRLAYWTGTLDRSEESPLLGHGIGSWPVIVLSIDDRGYPHNMFLEVLFELGTLGLTLLVCLILVALKGLFQRDALTHDPSRMFVLLLFVNVFVNAMVSGDISDNRAVFLALGLMAAAGMFRGQGFEAHPRNPLLQRSGNPNPL